MGVPLLKSTQTKRKRFRTFFITNRFFGLLFVFLVSCYNLQAQDSINCPCTILTQAQMDEASSSLSNNDGTGGIELGVKFRASVNGYITGIRFYKSVTNTGTHIGQLWSSTGSLLAQATFLGESSSGWQQVTFVNPVAITAGVTYIAAYHSSAGNYSATANYFTTTVANGALKNLANGEDGINGLYRYTNIPRIPNNSYMATNYWVDVLFSTTLLSDVTSPLVESVTPQQNEMNVNIGSQVNIVFNESIDPSTVSSATVELRNAQHQLIPASVSYNSGDQRITLVPSSPLNYSSIYSVNVNGGVSDPRIKDVSGNALASNYSFEFITEKAPAPPVITPAEGPGGPVLILSSFLSPFSRYPVEILKAEGWNAYKAMDITEITAQKLSEYEIVLLGQMSLSTAQLNLLNDWTEAGGTLIAFRPDAQLSTLMGINPAGSTLSEGYLLINTTDGPGMGIVDQTMQFHGTADLYNVNAGTKILATLFSNATTATNYPAVTSRNVGSNGGQAIAFTYDLSKSIVYTRQGNPAWAGQDRDGETPVRSNDLFFGNAGNDPQTDWVDLSKVAIPQADEQQRFLTNIMLLGNQDKKPLPRFWFLPKGLKAAVVMTGDDHGNGGTVGRFNQYLSLSGSNNTPEAVADWLAIRGTSYIYPGTPITNAQVISFKSAGFEIGLHVTTNCQNFTNSSLTSAWQQQWQQLSSIIPALSIPQTGRIHCLVWSDWATQAKVQAARGVKLDANYYYYPGAWVQNRPGMFTGSGMPMRFADSDGSIIDCYQLATQMTDESGQVYPDFVNALLDKAIGQEGYYGVFCANMHTDFATANDVSTLGSNGIISAAMSRQIPVISAKQMLDWLEGRNNATFSTFIWENNQLSFTVTADNILARNIQAVLPKYSSNGELNTILYNGSSIPFTFQVIKGIEYAFFNSPSGDYVATYGEDVTAPEISNVQVIPNSNGTAIITWETNEATNSKVDFGISSASLTQNVSNGRFVTNHSMTLTGLSPAVTYYFHVTSVDRFGNGMTSPASPAQPLSFMIPCSVTGTLELTGNTCVGQEINLNFNSGTGQAPFSLVLNNNTVNNVSNNVLFHSGVLAGPITDLSIWAPSEVGGSVKTSETLSVELGVKFRTTVPGMIKAIRFYKTAESGSGIFSVKLWNKNTGELVTPLSAASKTFQPGDNSVGWQQVYFSAPVQIEANTTYIATYVAPNGRYMSSQGDFLSAKTNGPITALASGTDGTNGVFRYQNDGNMPMESFDNTNYWVDVVFNPATAITLSSITDANGCNMIAPDIQTLYVNSLACSNLPVTFIDFSLNTVKNNAELFWTTSSETNNKGFDIERSVDGINWAKIGFVKGSVKSQVIQKYQFTDPGLSSGKYFYRLKQQDFDNQFVYSKVVIAKIAGSISYSLDQNYPNPVKQSTVIGYATPERTMVSITLYDVQGRMVKSLVNGIKEAGAYTYTLNTDNLSKGIYYYTMRTTDFKTTMRLIIE